MSRQFPYSSAPLRSVKEVCEKNNNRIATYLQPNYFEIQKLSCSVYFNVHY